MRNHIPNRGSRVPNKFNRTKPMPSGGRSGGGKVKTRARHRKRY